MFGGLYLYPIASSIPLHCLFHHHHFQFPPPSWFQGPLGSLWPKQLFAGGSGPGPTLLRSSVTLCLAGYPLPKGKALFPTLKLLSSLLVACPYQGGQKHEQALAPALRISSMHALAGPIGQPGVALSDVMLLWLVRRHHASLSCAACSLAVTWLRHSLVLPGTLRLIRNLCRP